VWFEYIKNGAILVCPETWSAPYGSSSMGANISQVVKGKTINQSALNFISPGMNWSYISNAKLSQFKKPSQTIMLVDTTCNDPSKPLSGYYYVYRYAVTTTKGGKVGCKHDNSGIVSWVDGHVSSENIRNKNNPYENYPFSNGSSAGAVDNYWDRD
jgi:prepilin-type processing-associated H-X9-DG protein